MIEFYEVATSKRSEPVRPAAGQGGETKRAAPFEQAPKSMKVFLN